MGHPSDHVRRPAHVLDESSDDEIKYETAPKTVLSDDALEAGVEDDTSDDDTGSGVDDDEAFDPASLRGAGASPRQLFHPPEESDYGDETDEDIGTGSSSSSSESSPAAEEEPMVALPSANIQHRKYYPEQNLETAKSGRPYHAWFGTQYTRPKIGKSQYCSSLTDILHLDAKLPIEKSDGALFPDGYQRCTRVAGSSWICAVRSCRQLYRSHWDLGAHFKVIHKRW